MNVFVTGGAGYIGSHTCVELIQAGYGVVIYDNLCNSRIEVINRIERITGIRPIFVEGDVRDADKMSAAMTANRCEAVVHFAGLKAVGESVAKPLEYYDNNVNGSLRVLQAMHKAGINRIVFSSSATVYGAPQSLPLKEDHPLCATNPYGETKLVIEGMLKFFAAADPSFGVAILRYFNPIGAHESGLMGEDPRGIPNNLLPYIAQVAVGKLECLSVWGNDYDTVDGTGVRDYVHVVDLAKGHVCALSRLVKNTGSFTVNLGTGRGYSVLEAVRFFEAASGKKVPVKICARRTGDVAACYADPSLARELLGWSAQLDMERMCADGWRWQSANPNGYE